MITDPAALSVASLPVGDAIITVSTPGAGRSEIRLTAPAAGTYPQHAVDALLSHGFRMVGDWENFGHGPNDPGVWYAEAEVIQ